MKKKNSVLVTGGAGFLGSNLCERLLKNGKRVVCIDDMSSGDPANIDRLSSYASFEFHRHDVVEPFGAEVSQIYNLACPASPVAYQRDPVKTTMTCVVGARNMLELASRNQARILQASTSEVYGDPEIHPQTEEYRGSVSSTGPRACYDEGKRCAESLFFDYFRRHGTDIRVARIFNTYGPYMRPDDGRVISNFIVQALASEALTVNGDGSQTRSPCFVDDMIDGFLALMSADNPGRTGPYNLGNTCEYSVNELAESVQHAVGSSLPLEYSPVPHDDPKKRRPDITRAQTDLGWHPKVDLTTGLRATVGYFRERIQREGQYWTAGNENAACVAPQPQDVIAATKYPNWIASRYTST